ncbi:MAG: signal recognition particle protein Srp19 [Candidatus Bathyarchaeota archaeon]|nr:signal recognition particle protein Srp19 [Candidatus Bathyarchaeota archaeon]
MRKLEGKCIIWLAYFDVSKTRKEGRRVPKKLAIENLKTGEIIKAAETLNLNVKLKAEAKYPRAWWDKSGYVVVDKKETKNKTLMMLAEKILELRKIKL